MLSNTISRWHMMLGATSLAALALAGCATTTPPIPIATPATELTLQLTNPKAIIFWLAISAVGATQNAPMGVVALFVAGAFCLALMGHLAYASLLSSRPFRFAYDRARRWIEAGVGTCLTLFAFRLATERS